MVYCRDLTPCNHYKLYIPSSSLALRSERGPLFPRIHVSVLGAITCSAGGAPVSVPCHQPRDCQVFFSWTTLDSILVEIFRRVLRVPREFPACRAAREEIWQKWGPRKPNTSASPPREKYIFLPEKPSPSRFRYALRSVFLIS